MMKSYDRVEWGFLERMMLRMGFHEQWVQMIVKRVSSVSYKVRFNDTETEEFLQLISHLLFANDPLILLTANMQSANTLKRILDVIVEVQVKWLAMPIPAYFLVLILLLVYERMYAGNLTLSWKLCQTNI
jgi:hypothetical protein